VAIFNRHPEGSYVQAEPMRFDKLGHRADKADAGARFAREIVPTNVRARLIEVIEAYFHRFTSGAK
jgi:hypothetical protein